MVSERFAARAVLGALLALLALLAVPPVPVAAAPPWWTRVAFSGERVDLIATDGGTLRVRAGGGQYSSDDQGAHFHAEAAVLHRGGSLQARSPSGLEIALRSDGVLWRRAPAGEWGRSLVLLPRGLLAGTPAVTALTAFDRPVSSTVYVATDGYSVLITNDGVDWTRAGPGLPDHVLALATDSGSRAVYAGTSDGLWVHHLRPLPRPPDYADAGLWLRWLGVLAVVAVTSAAAVALLRWSLPAGR